MTDQNSFAIAELQQKANDGDAQAQFDLALCYATGKAIEKNDELAFNWHKKAAGQGHVNAQFALGLYYLKGGRLNDTLFQKWFKDMFITKNVDPAFDLAVRQALISVNDDLAFVWFKNAVEQNHTGAQYYLALCYFEGIGIEQNDGLAFEWFKKAADQGYVEAQGKLAQCYFEGKCVEQNDSLAFEWFEKAAEQGFTEAQYWLALCYLEGKGAEKNDKLAVEWFKKRAENFPFNDDDGTDVCLFLSELYAQGKKGVEQNNELALKWKKQAQDLFFCHHSKEDYEQLQLEFTETWSKVYYRLAKSYLNNKGVDEDFILGMEYWLKAAEKGHTFTEDWTEDQYQLALCYFEGKGIDKSYKHGMKWMIIAARQGHVEATNWLTNTYLFLAIPSYFWDKEDAEQYYKFAVDWCLKEVGGHNADGAYLLLGVLYYSGKGVEQSDERALECFKKGVDAGNALYEDEINLAVLFLNKLYLSSGYAQGKFKGVECCDYHHEIYLLDDLSQAFEKGLISISSHCYFKNHKVFLTLLNVAIYKNVGEYGLAKDFIKEVFDKDEDMDKNLREVCLTAIEQELEAKNKALESEIKEKKALHEKEKEMLSFFTHTMRNALATAPQSLREAIDLLGGDVYEKDTKHYKAINKIAALFSTLSLTDCLIDTFKQSISDPQEFKQSWHNDHTGEATPKWVIASALRQALNRIIFMSDTSELRKLLDNPETALIKETRKSFIEEVLPLNVESQGVDVFYAWTLNHIPAIEVSIADCDKLNFGVNQIRFSLLFAITSELILNALKYWDGENRIQISWQLAEQDNYVFSVKNHCKANATSNLAGTHKGLAFIKRLVELLGEQAQFVCKSEDQLFIAELILNKALFDGEV